MSTYANQEASGPDHDEGGSGAQANFGAGASDPHGPSISPQAERARQIAAAARARTARIRAADFGVDTRAAPRAASDVGRPAGRDEAASEPVRRPGPESRIEVDRPAATEPSPVSGRGPQRAKAVVDPGAEEPSSNEAPGIKRVVPPSEMALYRPTVRETSPRPATREIAEPARRSQTREAATAPAGETAAPSPPDPAPPPGNGAAAGPFARTKQAIEAERRDAEGGRAWSHVLRTPEEIGATPASSSVLGRLLRRLFRLDKAAEPGAGAPPDRGAIGIGASGPTGLARRRSRTSPGAIRNGVTFVLALGTSALVTSLLFAGLLGLPGDVPKPEWGSWPFGATDPSTAPAAKGEVVFAGLPEAQGQGGPEIALGARADGSNGADRAADVAAGERPASGVVVVAGSAQDAWRQYYLLGHRLHAAGDLHGAVEMYREAASLEPDDANTFYDWARALQMLGDRDAAIEKYRAALDLAPESRTGADARARLSELRPH